VNHAITVGGLLACLAAIGGLIAVAFGLLMLFAAGMSDASDDGTGGKGCTTSVAGLIVLVASVLFLASCAHTPPPEPQIQTVETKVPVPVPCKAEVTVHQSYSDALAAFSDDIYQQVVDLLTGGDERDADIERLKGAVVGCGGKVTTK
jgi:hypothetical protein